MIRPAQNAAISWDVPEYVPAATSREQSKGSVMVKGIAVVACHSQGHRLELAKTVDIRAQCIVASAVKIVRGRTHIDGCLTDLPKAYPRRGQGISTIPIIKL